jgi:hypothetical protein
MREAREGRTKNNHTLNGLGVLVKRMSGKDSAKKSNLAVEDIVPVPETDTGGQVENTKGSERTLSKELGKMTP